MASFHHNLLWLGLLYNMTLFNLASKLPCTAESDWLKPFISISQLLQ